MVQCFHAGTTYAVGAPHTGGAQYPWPFEGKAYVYRIDPFSNLPYNLGPALQGGLKDELGWDVALDGTGEHLLAAVWSRRRSGPGPGYFPRCERASHLTRARVIQLDVFIPAQAGCRARRTLHPAGW